MSDAPLITESQSHALAHTEVERKDDEALRSEAQRYLVAHPTLQLMAELLTRLRASSLPWWTPPRLRARWPAAQRMGWLERRADVRQQITTQLTGLAPRATRKKAPEFQAQLIDAVVDANDISPTAFEEAFDPIMLALYGPCAEYWQQFRAWLPWDQDIAAHQHLVGWLFDALLTNKSSVLKGQPRKPILTHWQLRTAIASKVWHARMPLDVRAAIDDARFEREHSNAELPFHAMDDLSIALPELVAQHIQLKDLVRVFDVAERALGFVRATPASVAAPTAAPIVVPVSTPVTPTRGVAESSTASTTSLAAVTPPAATTPIAPVVTRTVEVASPVVVRSPEQAVQATAKTVEMVLPAAKPAETPPAPVPVPVPSAPEVDASAAPRAPVHDAFADMVAELNADVGGAIAEPAPAFAGPAPGFGPPAAAFAGPAPGYGPPAAAFAGPAPGTAQQAEPEPPPRRSIPPGKPRSATRPSSESSAKNKAVARPPERAKPPVPAPPVPRFPVPPPVGSGSANKTAQFWAQPASAPTRPSTITPAVTDDLSVDIPFEIDMPEKK